jgi:hypothetical protein
MDMPDGGLVNTLAGHPLISFLSIRLQSPPFPQVTLTTKALFDTL